MTRREAAVARSRGAGRGRLVRIDTRPHYWPVGDWFVVAFLVLVVAVVAIIEVGVVSYAYGRLGLDWRWACAILLASILGSRWNIPIAHLRGVEVFRPALVWAFGMLYVVPRTVRTATKVLAVNVGGAIVPAVLSGYLIVHVGLGWAALIATAGVGVVVHVAARIVPGVGIVVPTLVPPATAALLAWALEPGAIAALAYVGGTLGTLVGGDLANLRRIRALAAPIVSIGGSGTFDGIFVTGILAVLLAAL